MSEAVTRREFVAATAVVAASVAIMGTAGCTSMSGTRSDGDMKVPTRSASYGGDRTMSKRVLVGYATGTGSTVGVAQAIGKALGRRGCVADVKPMKERPSLEDYDAVVLGSAINGGKWLPEAVSYLEANRDALADVPVSLFCVHAMNTGPEPKKVARRHRYLDKQRALVKPASEGFFAGIGLTSENSNWFTRWAFRAFGGDVEGDGRDWNKIRAWAARVPV